MKLKSSLRKTSWIIVALLLLQCSNSRESYPYIRGFSHYLRNEQKIDITSVNETIFYILPLHSCAPCAYRNVTMLENLGNCKLLKIITVGAAEDNEMALRVSKLCANNTCLQDSSQTIFSYETGLGKPLLIHIKQGEVVHYIYVTDFKIPEVTDYLKSTY